MKKLLIIVGAVFLVAFFSNSAGATFIWDQANVRLGGSWYADDFGYYNNTGTDIDQLEVHTISPITGAFVEPVFFQSPTYPSYTMDSSWTQFAQLYSGPNGDTVKAYAKTSAPLTQYTVGSTPSDPSEVLWYTLHMAGAADASDDAEFEIVAFAGSTFVEAMRVIYDGGTGTFSGAAAQGSYSTPLDFDTGSNGMFILPKPPPANPVPEPTTLILLGSGLIGLAGFRKKFKK